MKTIIKTCTKCKEEKPAADFPPRKRGSKDGLNSWCRACYRNVWTGDRRKDYLRKQQENRWRRRIEIINQYGGICACCGESELLFLTLDHIDNNGAEHRKEIGQSSDKLHRWIVKNNYPDSIQVLCYNCNMAKGHFGQCPHKEPANKKYLKTKKIIDSIIYCGDN